MSSMLHPAIKQGKRFQNPIPTDMGGLKILFPYLREYLTTKAELSPKKPLGPFATDTTIYNTKPTSGLRVTWIGHSTLFIELDGIRILTDPVWSNRVSFSKHFGPHRFFQPPIPLLQLPVPDIIIISHDHYDHLDKDTIKVLANTPAQFYTSTGVGRYLKLFGVDPSKIMEMNWMDQQVFQDRLTITALPTRHFSGRSINNNYETLWSSFALKTSAHNIYYGADSGWWDGFKEIGERFGPFDLDFLEIGAYGKGWPDIHMGPDKAMHAHQVLHSPLLFPIHWGTFNLALHDWREPGERIVQLAREHEAKLILPSPGEPVEITKTQEAYINEWWKR